MQAASNHHNILVVDGSDIVLNRITLLLQELPAVCGIQTAKTLDQAQDIINHTKQDLVLFDLALQEKTGFELLKFIKQVSPGTKTMVLTNLTDDLYRNKCREMGADYFIDKSSEFEQLSPIISKDLAMVNFV